VARVRLSKLHINEIIYSRGGTKWQRRDRRAGWQAGEGKQLIRMNLSRNSAPRPLFYRPFLLREPVYLLVYFKMHINSLSREIFFLIKKEEISRVDKIA